MAGEHKQQEEGKTERVTTFENAAQSMEDEIRDSPSVESRQVETVMTSIVWLSDARGRCRLRESV